MARLYGQPEQSSFSAHLGGSLWIPIGVEDKHAGDANVRGLIHGVLSGVANSHLRWSFEAGVSAARTRGAQ